MLVLPVLLSQDLSHAAFEMRCLNGEGKDAGFPRRSSWWDSLLVFVSSAATPSLLARFSEVWGKAPVRGDTAPRHEPGTGRDHSRNTPLGGERGTTPLGRCPGSSRATHETTPPEGCGVKSTRSGPLGGV